jgi:hypothetical protein
MGDEIRAMREKYYGPPIRDRGTIVGRRDPGTSAIAASKVRNKLAESEGMILGVLAQQAQPITSCQIAERLTFKICRGEPRDYGWWRLEVSRRMRGLVRTGKVLEGLSKRCPVAETIQTTWSIDKRRERPHWQD